MKIILFLILLVGLCLRVYQINELMPFIGDQGWFYLSARDIVINQEVPLVGISSSRPWLHQGPFWTYLLAPFLLLFNFNPISGVYLSIFFGLLSIIGICFLGTKLFSKRVGLIASLLFATSPLVVSHDRLPYHTSPIPFFTIILIFFLYKILINKIVYIPFAILILSILYNFEIATIVLWVVLILIILYKLFKKTIILREIINRKIISMSIISLIIPLLPMILYDIRNGFPQTIKFSAWVFYRIISLFGYNPEHAFSIEKMSTMIHFLFINSTKLIFPQSSTFAIIILLSTIAWIMYKVRNKKEKNISYKLICISIVIPLILIILNQTPSDAYLSILFPTSIMLISAFLSHIMQFKKLYIFILILIFFVIYGNVSFLHRNNFTFDKRSERYSLEMRFQASKKILDIAQKNDYNLIGRGPGSEHESFTMNYEYLTWWLGHPPSKKDESLKIYISESEKGIKIEKND